MHDLGVVVIGRNEGDRLRRCLASLGVSATRAVYVDSGSSDDSVRTAASFGVATINLDTKSQFTAARARNAGFRKLLDRYPTIEYVQFVDGDCELASTWLDSSVARLSERSQLAAVCGRLYERNPNASVYNRLCDMEWNTVVGETRSCGGVALYRSDALCGVNGFNDLVSAGEEPELCVRLRKAGWRIERLNETMGWHDAAIFRFHQWWKRAVRGGYAYAQGAALHGASIERHNIREVRSAVLWGGVFPLFLTATLIGAICESHLFALVAGVSVAYVVQLFRIWRHRRQRGDTASDSLLYSIFTLIGKTAQCWGCTRFWLSKHQRSEPQLIEYKAPSGVVVR